MDREPTTSTSCSSSSTTTTSPRGARRRDGWQCTETLSLIAAAIAGAGLTVINYYLLGYTGDAIDVGSWGSFFTTYATLFAIISGMVLVNVLERFAKINNVLEEELNAIQSIRDSLVYLNLLPDERADFVRVLYRYLVAIADREWALMADQGGNNPTDIDTDTSIELAAIHIHVADLMNARQSKQQNQQQPQHEAQHQSDTATAATTNLIVAQVMIPLVLDLGKLRTNRLSLAMAQLPHRLKYLLAWMIFFLVIGFILMSVQNLYVNVFMTVAVTGAIQWLYAIIIDLDRPFSGIWNVDRVQLDLLINQFAVFLQLPEAKVSCSEA